MGMPWGYGPKEFTVTAGDDQIVQLAVPHRGTIKAINLQQLGAADAGAFELYDAEAAVQVLVGNSSSSAIPGGEPASHSITAGEIPIVAGAYQANNLNIPYINRDGTPTNGVRRLWMRINVTGSGDKTFNLGMTIEPPPLNG